MNKIFTTFVLTIIFSLSFSQQFLGVKIERSRDVSVEIVDVSPFVNVTLDLFHGIESSLNMTYMIPTFPRCEESYLLFWNHSQETVKYFQNNDYQNAVFSLGTTLGDVEDLLKDCGNGTAEALRTIKEFNDMIRSDPKAFYGNLTQRMVSNSKDILFTIAEIVNYHTTQQYFKLGESIGKLVKILLIQNPATDKTIVMAAFNASDVQLSNCLVELQYISTDLKDLLEALKAETFDANAIADSLSYILESVPTALDSCGFKNLSTLASAGLKSIDPLKCVVDVEELVNTGRAIVQDVNTTDFSKLLQDINTFVAEGSAFSRDCLGTNSTVDSIDDLFVGTDIFACFSDLKNEISEVTNLINSIRAGNISEVISLLQPLLNNTENLISDCGLSNSSFALKLKETNPEDCITDIQGLLQIGNQIENDAKSANIQALLNDVVEFVSEGQKTIRDCTGSNSSVLYDDSLKGIVQCIADVERTVENFQTLENDLKAENQSAIISDITLLVADVNSLMADCRANNSFLSEGLKNIKPEGCAQDISDLRNLSRLITNDYTNADSQNLIAHVYDFITEAHQALDECGGKLLPVHFNRSNETKQCILSLHTLITDIKVAGTFVQSRNLSGLGEALERVRADLKNVSIVCNISDPIANELIQSNPQQCLSDIETAISDANLVSQDISSQDFSKAITDALSLVKAVQTAVTDCTQSNFTDAFVKEAETTAQCALDLLSLKQNISSFVQLLKVNRTAAGVVLKGILDSVPQLVNDCGANNQSIVLERIHSISPIACLEDLEALYQEGNTIVSDISSGNVSSIISEVIAFYNTAERAYTDCAGQNFTEDYQVFSHNVLTCVHDIEDLVKEVKVFSNDVKTENITHIVSDISVIVNTGKATLNDCNFGNMSIPHYENFDRIDPVQCGNEVVVLSSIMRNITSDFQEKNISNLVYDVKNLVNLGEAFVRDCAGFEFNSTRVQQCVKTSDDILDNLGGLLDDLKRGDQTFDLISRFASLSAQIPLAQQYCKLAVTESNTRVLFELNLESAGCQSTVQGIIAMIPKFFSCTSTTEWSTLTIELQGRLIQAMKACTSSD